MFTIIDLIELKAIMIARRNMHLENFKRSLVALKRHTSPSLVQHWSESKRIWKDSIKADTRLLKALQAQL